MNWAKRLDRPIKAAERTARRIIQSITDRELAPGAMLESEAEMLRNLNVSRGTLREALRLLEAQGLVFMKSGPSGGPIVGEADPFYLGRMATLFFRLAGATYNDIGEALLIIDPLVAKLAAERSVPGMAGELMSAIAAESCKLIAQSGPASDAVITMKDVHRTLSLMCGNPVLGLLSDSLGSIFAEHIVAVSDATSILGHSHDDHIHIAESVIRGDGEAAFLRAQAHLQRLIDFHRSQVPGIFTQPVRWR